MVCSIKFLTVYNKDEVRTILGEQNTDMNHFKIQCKLLYEDCRTILKYEGFFIYVL